MTYEIKLDIFEGPLDLLLHLIEKNEVSISDIPVAQITKQYLETIETMRSLNLEMAGEYLLMASYLTHIKSQMLLPRPERDKEEYLEGDEDPRAELVAHLLEYRRYKAVANSLDVIPLWGREVFSRESLEPGLTPHIQSSMPIDINELFCIMREIIERRQPETLLEIKNETMSLREKVQDIMLRLQKSRWLSFGSLFSDDFSRSNIVITFLALLEVVKSGAARIYQETPFGSIVISRC
ncbi:MAG: segregation/condensation protein A [Pseudomonadota bacterium]